MGCFGLVFFCFVGGFFSIASYQMVLVGVLGVVWMFGDFLKFI